MALAACVCYWSPTSEPPRRAGRNTRGLESSTGRALRGSWNCAKGAASAPSPPGNLKKRRKACAGNSCAGRARDKARNGRLAWALVLSQEIIDGMVPNLAPPDRRLPPRSAGPPRLDTPPSCVAGLAIRSLERLGHPPALRRGLRAQPGISRADSFSLFPQYPLGSPKGIPHRICPRDPRHLWP
jgi:hypothetical protein